jgi:methylmalonyl-CoA carboxyltransferase 12S subunit
MATKTKNSASDAAADLQTALQELLQRVEGIEKSIAPILAAYAGKAPVPAAAPAPVAAPAVAAPAGLTEEEILAVSAAIGAYLGVRVHIRQIRLVSTAAWAQQGRVSIQASHRL